MLDSQTSPKIPSSANTKKHWPVELINEINSGTLVRHVALLPKAQIFTYKRRDAYLELIRAYGPDMFDVVPDRFGLRELVKRESELEDEMRDHLNDI